MTHASHTWTFAANTQLRNFHGCIWSYMPEGRKSLLKELQSSHSFSIKEGYSTLFHHEGEGSTFLRNICKFFLILYYVTSNKTIIFVVLYRCKRRTQKMLSLMTQKYKRKKCCNICNANRIRVLFVVLMILLQITATYVSSQEVGTTFNCLTKPSWPVSDI
jgi:hypothetical protein